MLSYAGYFTFEKNVMKEDDLALDTHISRLVFLFYSYATTKQIYRCDSGSEDTKD